MQPGQISVLLLLSLAMMHICCSLMKASTTDKAPRLNKMRLTRARWILGRHALYFTRDLMNGREERTLRTRLQAVSARLLAQGPHLQAPFFPDLRQGFLADAPGSFANVTSCPSLHPRPGCSHIAHRRSGSPRNAMMMTTTASTCIRRAGCTLAFLHEWLA